MRHGSFIESSLDILDGFVASILSLETSGSLLDLTIGRKINSDVLELLNRFRCIKIWDSASGKLRLTLTGHISEVRGVKVSTRHPYIFSCGQDHTVKCWDMEYNRVIRHYHGHLSSVYGLDLHPTIDVLVSGLFYVCFAPSNIKIKSDETRVVEFGT